LQPHTPSLEQKTRNLDRANTHVKQAATPETKQQLPPFSFMNLLQKQWRQKL